MLLPLNYSKLPKKGLEAAKLIKTSKLTNSITFTFDPLETDPNRSVEVDFFYDEKTKTLTFPLISLAGPLYGSGTVTDKWIEYRFNGQYFIREKN